MHITFDNPWHSKHIIARPSLHHSRHHQFWLVWHTMIYDLYNLSLNWSVSSNFLFRHIIIEHYHFISNFWYFSFIIQVESHSFFQSKPYEQFGMKNTHINCTIWLQNHCHLLWKHRTVKNTFYITWNKNRNGFEFKIHIHSRLKLLTETYET